MNIGFISCLSKTKFFDAVASELIKKGYDVYWFAVNMDIYNKLIEIYGDDRVLLINKSIAMNKKIGEFKLNELIYHDRALRYDYDEATKYLISIQKPIFDFIQLNSVRYIFGENTASHEVLIMRICKKFQSELKCRYLAPFMMRIPDNRFAFFEDEFLSKPRCVKEVEKCVHKNFMNENFSDSDYSKITNAHINNKKALKYKLRRIMSFIFKSSRDKYDPTLRGVSRKVSLRVNVLNYYNKVGYHSIPKVNEKEFINDQKKKIIFPLQLQPETNIDTNGRYYDDQLQSIINIWRVMPDNFTLYVKEHRVAIGNRGAHFFNELLKLRNVKVLHESISPILILNHIEYVATITGTMGLEAGMMNIKVLAYGDNTYNDLQSVVKVGLEDFRNCDNLEALYLSLKQKKETSLTSDQYLAQAMLCSFEGDGEGDVLGNPSVLGLTNINMVASAFDRVMNEKDIT